MQATRRGVGGLGEGVPAGRSQKKKGLAEGKGYCYERGEGVLATQNFSAEVNSRKEVLDGSCQSGRKKRFRANEPGQQRKIRNSGKEPKKAVGQVHTL